MGVQKRKRIVSAKTIVATMAAAVVVLALSLCLCVEASAKSAGKEKTEGPSGPERPRAVTQAVIGSTGDILLHTPILDACYNAETGKYDFTETFSLVKPFYEDCDIMAANLEVTLGGSESGEYSGYPAFNSPDSIAEDLKSAGVDLLLTANNHSYDTGSYGFHRTQEVLDGLNLVHIGTRKSTDERYIYFAKVNGIKLALACYTYDTRQSQDEQKSLNGNILSPEDEELVNSFSYSDPDALYENVKSDIEMMNAVGAEANIFYLHWGNEYEDEPNDVQREIAQKLCDLGADVIVGGHPHVIQRMEELTGSNGNKTVCLYSMGNELSNQRAVLMSEDGNRGYTEDGVIFTVRFEKLNNGKVKLRKVSYIPTWVDMYFDADGKKKYVIVPLNKYEAGNWKTSDNGLARASYERTAGRIGEISE